MGENADTVRRTNEAFDAGDRATLEELLGDDLHFESPDDPHLDKAGFFERCYPNRGHMADRTVDKLFEVGDDVVINYTVTKTDGSRFHNVELIRVTDGKVRDIQVYYGATLT